VIHYGYRFDYAANAVDRMPLTRDIPVQCLNVVERLLQQQIITCLPDQLTVNQYQPGQGTTIRFSHSQVVSICYNVP